MIIIKKWRDLIEHFQWARSINTERRTQDVPFYLLKNIDVVITGNKSKKIPHKAFGELMGMQKRFSQVYDLSVCVTGFHVQDEESPQEHK